MSQELGCTQNQDGSLKDAHNIQFMFSQSSSSVNLQASQSIEPSKGTVPPIFINAFLKAQNPCHGRVPKPKHSATLGRPKSSPYEHVHLDLNAKMEIAAWWDNAKEQ